MTRSNLILHSWQASESEMKGDELSRMRGYRVDKVETKEIVFNGSGTHIVDE
jgi:hypothetical protein